MQKFILCVNVFQLVLAWLVYMPAYIIHNFTKRLSRITYLKVALFSLSLLFITDFIELIVRVLGHVETKWLTWASPVLWALILISLHIEYVKLNSILEHPSKDS